MRRIVSMNHGKQNKPAWKFGSALGSVNKALAISLNDIGTVYHAKPKYEKNPATWARCLGRVTKMLLSFLALTACVCVSQSWVQSGAVCRRYCLAKFQLGISFGLVARTTAAIRPRPGASYQKFVIDRATLYIPARCSVFTLSVHERAPPWA